MKVTQRTPAQRDPRTALLAAVVADAGVADAVRAAPTPEQAWRALGLPGERDAVDPDALARLLAAASALCLVSDAIGRGLGHFGELPPDAEVPEAWVARMADLHAEELDGYVALDDLAVAGLGHWAVGDPPAADPVARVATRVRWQLDGIKPPPTLALDRGLRDLGRATDPAAAKEAGRALVRRAAERRFAAWQTTRRTP